MPYSDLYDPRPENLLQPTSADSRRQFGLKLQEIAGDIQCLDILFSPEERSRPTTDYTDKENISIINKATTYFKEIQSTTSRKY